MAISQKAAGKGYLKSCTLGAVSLVSTHKRRNAIYNNNSMTTRTVRLLLPLLLLLALSQREAMTAPGEDASPDGQGTSPGMGEGANVGSERSTTPGMVSVDRAGSERSRPRQELAVNEKQRQQYTQALAKLHSGDLARFQRLRGEISGHVLLPYLDYEFPKDRITTTPASKLHDFLERNPAGAVTDQLRRRWLELLPRRGDWSTFISEFRDIGPADS